MGNRGRRDNFLRQGWGVLRGSSEVGRREKESIEFLTGQSWPKGGPGHESWSGDERDPRSVKRGGEKKKSMEQGGNKRRESGSLPETRKK